MNLDDLLKVAQSAVRTSGRSDEFSDIIMVRATVLALRDDFAQMHSSGESGAGFLGGVDSKTAADRKINEILGEPEAAAGGPTREDGLDDTATAEPAADLCEDCPPVWWATDKTRCTPCPRRRPAADAVCVWRETSDGPYSGCGRLFDWQNGNCPECGKKIQFKEPPR